MKSISIVGASGHGKVVADIAALLGYESIVFYDDDETKEQCGQYKVKGRVSDVIGISDDVIVAIGNGEIRKKILEMLAESNKKIVSLIHPQAVIASNVEIGSGTVIMAGSVINSDTVIGNGVIVNTCASIDHDCIIGDYVHVAVGAHICGTVEICDGVWVGAGTIINNNLRILKECMIGSGAVVVEDISEEGKYVGIPARNIDL